MAAKWVVGFQPSRFQSVIVLDSRVTTSQKCAAVPRRARIEGS